MRFNNDDYLKAFPRKTEPAAPVGVPAKDPDPGDALQEEPEQVIKKDPEPEEIPEDEGGEPVGDE